MSRRKAEREKHLRRQYESDLKWLMADVRGRRVVASLLEEAGVGMVPRSAMTGNAQTYFNLGQQDHMRGFALQLRAVALADFRKMEDEIIASQTIDEGLTKLPDEEDPEQ